MISVLHVLASPGAAAVRLLPILADAAIKGVVVFGVAAVAVMFCRRCSAATRHAIWAGAVLAQLTLPVMSAMLPAWRVPLIDRLEPVPVLAPMPAAAPAAFDVIFTPPVPAVAPLPIVIATGEGRGEGAGVGEGRAYLRSHIARAATRAARRARATTATAFAGGGYSLEPAPRFSLLGTVRSLRSRATSWWLRTGAVVWLLGALAIWHFCRLSIGTSQRAGR